MITVFEDGRSAALASIAGCQSLAKRHCLVEDRRDHRLVTYRDPSGELMCRAQAGLLFSEMPVTPQICGSNGGCDGTWRCLKIVDQNMVVSGV